jgi:hypothetical protein
MGFYYFSILSIVPLGIAYGLLALVLWGIARVTRGVPGRKALLVVLGAVFVILPVAEELWIAWNFGQACKRAGTFIYKRVQVDGFYDDTHGWRADKLRATGYRFVEGRDATSGRNSYWRHEMVGDQARSFRIDRPSARYHYKWPQRNALVGYKTYKQTEEVTDVQSGEVLGRGVQYGRTSPWYFLALDDPGMGCSVPNGKPRVLLYRLILEPAPTS